MGLSDGKVVIVTGAGGGIGRAEALAFAREGAKVVVNDAGVARDGTGREEGMAEAVAAEIRAVGGQAVANADSVATPEGAAAIVERAVSAFGRVDVLVANAGILRDKTLLKATPADFDEVVAVHLRGSFLTLQAAARRMVEQGEGGRIVLTTSVSGMMGNFGQAAYAAAKAGVYGLMRTAAIELQKHRITVNALAPIARTRMTEDLPLYRSAGRESFTVEHVAPVAVFLGSDLCGERTGHVLAVAGAHLYAYKVVQAEGRFTDGDRPWTPQEIAEHFAAAVKV